MPLMFTTWKFFPLIQFLTLKYLPPALWLPWFNVVSFVFGTYTAVKVKGRKPAPKPAPKEDD